MYEVRCSAVGDGGREGVQVETALLVWLAAAPPRKQTSLQGLFPRPPSTFTASFTTFYASSPVWRDVQMRAGERNSHMR